MEKEKIEKIIHITREMCNSHDFCKDCPYALNFDSMFFKCALKEGVILDEDDRNSPSITYGRAIGSVIHSYCGETSCNLCFRRNVCKFCHTPEQWETDEEE